MPVVPSRQSKSVAAYRRPQCTHTTMNRVRGVECSMCGRVPDSGWVYQCRQDYIRKEDNVPAPLSASSDVDGSDSFADKARVAEQLKINPSVINGIRAGNFTTSQANKLIAQKKNVLRAIREQEQGLQKPQLMPSANGIIATAGTSQVTPAKQTFTNRRDSAALSPLAPPAKCNYAICAACRPYFSDRLWASFETILHEQTQITAADAGSLPMMDPFIARTIGLRPSFANTLRAVPSPYSTEFSDMEAESAVSVDWSATNSGESDAGSPEVPDRNEPLPCPGPLLCPVFSRNLGCAYENEGFDDGKRSENHAMTPEHSRSQLSNYTYLAPSTPGAASTTASSVSLPSTPTASSISILGPEDTRKTAREKQLENGARQHGSTRLDVEEAAAHTQSTDSSKNEVDDGGGVALTH
ncbi:uncharacterized protein RHO25_004523 [Cercospora beticola]|nr:hypothetical protein RHO25_004523 [Cercospora beticola]